MTLRSAGVIPLAAALLTACSARTALPPTTAMNAAEPMPATVRAGVARDRLGDVTFAVALPLRDQTKLTQLLEAVQDPASPQFRHFISHDEFVRRFAPALPARAAVARELQAAGFHVSIADQAVIAGGTLAQAGRYFHTALATTRYGRVQIAAPRAPLALSNLLARTGATVVGLDGIPPMHVFSKIVPMRSGVRPNNIYGPYGPYFAVDLKQAYQYPSYRVATGSGVTIGIVIDSPVSTSDIDAYFSGEASPIAPQIADEKIDGGGQYGGDGTGEATLDVEQSAGMAPGAGVVIYDIKELSNADIYAAYSAVAHDDAVDIVNSSFGGCELQFKGAAGIKDLKAFDAVFQQGLSEGITWVAASGDHAALQCGSDNQKGVSWPADSPYVLAVGGTNLTTTHANGNPNSKYHHEDAYADVKPSDGGDYWGSGGGYSVLYARPSWQKKFVTKKGRGLPDLAVHMGGEGFSSGGSSCDAQKCNVDDSSDIEYVEGQASQSIGTSAASPDFVGLLALTAELVKSRLGFVNQVLYEAAAKHKGYYFRRALKGFNGYKTTSGLWDPVLGLGTPYGARIAGTKSVAGTPTSASNP